MKRTDVKIGMTLQCRGAQLKITGEGKHGFDAIQTYKGKDYPMVLFYVTLDNPHYEITEARG